MLRRDPDRHGARLLRRHPTPATASRQRAVARTAAPAVGSCRLRRCRVRPAEPEPPRRDDALVGRVLSDPAALRLWLVVTLGRGGRRSGGQPCRMGGHRLGDRRRRRSRPRGRQEAALIYAEPAGFPPVQVAQVEPPRRHPGGMPVAYEQQRELYRQPRADQHSSSRRPLTYAIERSSPPTPASSGRSWHSHSR